MAVDSQDRFTVLQHIGMSCLIVPIPFQGFDYARTEVGIESELERQRVPEYYRRYPHGSLELEGMYSPDETPPPRLRGQPPMLPPPLPPGGRGSMGKGGPPQWSHGTGPHGSMGYPPPPPPLTESMNKSAPKQNGVVGGKGNQYR